MAGIGMSPSRALVFASMLLAGVVTSSTPAAAQDARGAELFGLCSQCHGEQGAGNQLALAPAIAGLPQWYVEAQLGYALGHAEGNLISLIRNAGAALHAAKSTPLSGPRRFQHADEEEARKADAKRAAKVLNAIIDRGVPLDIVLAK